MSANTGSIAQDQPESTANTNDSDHIQGSEGAEENIVSGVTNNESNDPTSVTIDSFDGPSVLVMNSTNPSSLMSFVDGPRINPDDFSESEYNGRSIPVAARDVIEIPIVVPGPNNSTVEYTIESADYDISFGVSLVLGDDTMEGKESVIVAAPKSRVDSHLTPISGKFFVKQCPATILFTFDNTYSLMRSKEISYRITVTPPPLADVLALRRKRAEATLNAVKSDSTSAERRLGEVIAQRTELEKEIEQLQALILEKNKSKYTVEKEEAWLKKRLDVRVVQEEMLNLRLENGWDDEVCDIETTSP